MERRIKTVWILTIATALLVIGGQVYRLHIEYQYSAKRYMEILHERILQLEQEELQLRRGVRKLEESKYNLKYMYAIVPPNEDELFGKTTSTVIISDSMRRVQLDSFQVVVKHENALMESKSNLLIFNAGIRYITDLTTPFSTERFDSLLRANDIHMTDIRLGTTDGRQWMGSYTASTEGILPRMHIVYPYNPLLCKVLTATITPPLPSLLQQMAWQLAGSLLLIFVLMLCLVYQIKTILKQKRIEEIRGSFVNTMVHELKRPVQTLKMCIAFLNDKHLRTDETATEEVLKDSMDELDNLSAYLTKVRDMTRADYERLHINIGTLDLPETVNRLLRLYPSSVEKQIHIRTHYEMESPMVKADSVHLTNILNNLIENAVKYSGREVRIDLTCTLKNRMLTLTLSDDGIGIPLSEQGKVFDKFYRGSNIPDPHTPGIGLGLSYVKLLTEAHGGTLTLTSRPGKGTTFHIHLPQ